MKIKRLIIRNIASIEEGEIDFEKDLIDHDSGRPASLFLITGDTGSGKSVILDCISMSLYGTTPRVKSVNGIKNNNYRNNDGEEISVNDITQYTRIGISWKDDCYSELYFTGNDNVDYVSRYSLGRTSHCNYRKPEWTLKIGDSQIIENKKEEIREKIQSAVGLTFEQFSRMAMLAQGQFETFLTGKKEERERILEQLTATDIFSRYGDAITTIFKTSKQEYETSKKIYDELSKKILDKETIDKLTEDQSVKVAQAAACHKETERIRQCIKNTEDLINVNKELTGLQEESKRLRELEESVDYKERNAILNLWDTTTTYRELLSDKIKATDSLDADKKTLQEKKTYFILLSDDLSKREQDAKMKFANLEQQRLWIERQAPLKELFAMSSAVINNIKRFVTIGEEINKKEREIEKVNAELEVLIQTISSQKGIVAEMNKRCAESQTIIDEKTNERDALKPSLLREEKDKMVKRQSCLKDLSSRLEAVYTEIEESNKTEKEISKIVKSLSKLTDISEKASAECGKLEKKKEESESRYRTMLQCVEDNFKAIRRQLAEEHATHCPLCGQSIEDKFQEWNNENYFSKILSPLEEEKKKCAASYA
ncbi:MAG: SMC family ATPase, partial [Muribaculaceae bacterium]|nr:SMC family ATPase [Muribaculaceae bacterium]